MRRQSWTNFFESESSVELKRHATDRSLKLSFFLPSFIWCRKPRKMVLGRRGKQSYSNTFYHDRKFFRDCVLQLFSIISCKLRNYVGYPRTKLNNQLDCNGENAYFLWDSSLQYYLTCHMWIYLVPYVDISFANRFSIKCKLILQYTLSQTTVEQLKEPIFNIWHWEPNEVWRKFVLRSLSLRKANEAKLLEIVSVFKT